MDRHPRCALLAAALAAAAAVVWAVAFQTAAGARVDEATLSGFLALSGGRADVVARAIARLADPGPFAVWTMAIACVALVRRRTRDALMACVVLVGANVTTQVLKILTAEPRAVESLPGAHVEPQSWPSGHATASMALALSLIAVAPPRLRPLAAALGGLLAVAVVYSVLTLGWHAPSDVLGGFFVAGAWALAVVAFRWRVEGARPSRERAPRMQRAAAPTALALVAAGGGIAAVAFARGAAAIAYAEANTGFVAAAAVIGASGLTMAAGLAVALRD